VVEVFSEGLSSELRAELESYLRSFEASWDESLLGHRLRALPEEPLRRPAVLGMVAIDLRRRRQLGERVSIKSYLKKIPEMGSKEDLPARLLLVEYIARRQMGEDTSPEDFAHRFPNQVEELRRLVTDLREVPTGSPSVAAPEANGEEDGAPGLPTRFGRYEIVRKLGRGGMGQVYLARDTVLGREVAIKVPRLDKNDAIMHARFLREAQLAAQLHHPNLCTIHDAGVEHGIHFLTMAYIEGTCLSDFLREGKRWKPREAAKLVRLLARALAHAHSKGVIHRDLKPANVMMRQSGEPIIMDFGLARQVDVDDQDQRLTRVGSTMGTPIYMSPEQARGDRDQTGTGDVYSLGVILYELLTGRVPFEGSNVEVLAKVLLEEPPPPSIHEPEVDSAIEAICLRALQKSPEKRYRTMEEFAKALEQYLSVPGVQVVETPASPETTSRRDTKVFREAPVVATAVVERRPAAETMAPETPRQKRAADTVLQVEESTRTAERPRGGRPPPRKRKSGQAISPAWLAAGGLVGLAGLLGGLIVLVTVMRGSKRPDEKTAVQPQSPVTPGPGSVTLPPVGDQDFKTDIAALNAWMAAGKEPVLFVKEHFAKRLSAWRKAAADGIVEGQYLLGVCCQMGLGVTQNKAEAVTWFREAAGKGYAPAEYNLGLCYQLGQGVGQNNSEAVLWYQKAADKGLAAAENQLGVCYDKGAGVPKDPNQAASLFRKAAAKGHGDAENNLGVCYFHGNGVKQDPVEAVMWFRKAAEKGIASAQHNLGTCYKLGKGVIGDPKEAVFWFCKAAEQGHMVAENDLGFCYLKGFGVPKDEKLAVEWYQKAAAKGYPSALNNLGSCYYNGQGVAQNLNQAFRLIRKAAELGDVNAKYNLGLLYAEGKAVPKNDLEALRLWREAAAAGHAEAKKRLGIR
jgi:TPR repeat protein/serine/threonine protein kinase